jgi:hypothetical protein
MSVAIRVPSATHEQLRRLAAERKQPIGRIVAEAVDRLEEEAFWAAVHADYERLRADPEDWEAYHAEARELEVLSREALAEEPPYYAAGEDE